MVDVDITDIDIAVDSDRQTHPLSHIIRSITSKTKQRLQQEHRVTPRTENILSSGFTFSGSGARFQQYGKLNHQASGWNEDRIDRLLEPSVNQGNEPTRSARALTPTILTDI